MPYKKGDKFTIEITDVMTGEDGKTVYRMNDFNSLVFDEGGLDRLETAEPKKKSPFNRVEYAGPYYCIGVSGNVNCQREVRDAVDNGAFAVANYCTDKFLLEQRALHETLNRLLWRYSEEHGGDSKEWGLGHRHWYIFKYEDERGGFGTASNDAFNVQGIPYFATQCIANDAIHDIVGPFMAEHPEFVW